MTVNNGTVDKAAVADYRIRVVMVLLSILAVVAVGMVLKVAGPVVVPLIIAWLLAQLLWPAVRFLVRKKVSVGTSVTVVLLLFLVVCYWIGMLVSASAASFADELPGYRGKIEAITGDMVDRASVYLKTVSHTQLREEANRQIVNLVKTTLKLVGNLVGTLKSLVANVVIIFIITAFMLVGKPYGEDKIRIAFSPRVADRIRDIMVAISDKMSHYLLLQFLISLITGVLVWLACLWLGVGAALTWGALAFFLNFIPIIGSIISVIPPVLLTLLGSYPNVWPAVFVLLALLAIQQIMGNVVSPKVMGDRLDLSPVVILLSVLFWGWLWGVPGALLSVLLTSAIAIVCGQIDELRPVSVMLSSGRRYRKARNAEEDKASVGQGA